MANRQEPRTLDERVAWIEEQLRQANRVVVTSVSVTDHGGLTGLSDDDHPQYLQESLFDAKGDLVAATADNTPARLGVGSNGQVLTADSAEATGIKWAAAAGGVTDHGALTGLADDDHTQYLKEKASGGAASEVPEHTHTSAAEAGTLDYGEAGDITSVDIGDSAAAGATNEVADAGHTHAVPAPGAGYPLDVAAAEADGVATTPARSDHVHAHGSGYLPDAHHARQHSITSASDHTFPGGTTTFLRADGTFATPAGGGGGPEGLAFAWFMAGGTP